MISAQQGITNLDDLHEHLQYAIGLELTTVPAYLCALYSIKPGANTAARETIQSVVLEEMLHMALAANVLNAIGGTPSTASINGASPVPTYPATLAYIKGAPEICLQKFSPKALRDFIDIENPGMPDASDNGDQYASIGAFYAAIKEGVRKYCPPEVFEEARQRTRVNCQISGHDYYGGAGTLIKVTNKKSARDALKVIVDEGEGLPARALKLTAHEDKLAGVQTLSRRRQLGTAVTSAGKLAFTAEQVADGDVLSYGWKMYSHYARFKEIYAGRRYFPDQTVGEDPTGAILPTDWDAVRPMTTNPKAEDYKKYAWAYKPMMACNHTYTDLVDATYAGFNGKRDALRDAVGLMYKLKYQADALLNIPLPLDPEQTLGPAFQYHHD